MSKFQKHNLNNIKTIFENKTGTRIRYTSTTYHSPIHKAAVLAAMLALCVMLVAFTYPLFSPLEGDALTLRASYEGNGVVTIEVENHSHKNLEFQSSLKLVKWITGEEVDQLSDTIEFEGTSISAHSISTMTVDLSDAYDITMLEESMVSEWYYLVLTNHNFLFGQEWKCSIYFGTQELDPVEAEAGVLYTLDPAIMAQVEDELRFYFEDDYVGQFSANPMNYEYLQKVDELLLRSERNIVRSVNPGLMVKVVPDGIIFDETWPIEKQYTLAGQTQSIHDAFGKFVGATETEYVQILQAWAPTDKDAEDGFWSVPLLFFSTYEVSAIESDDDCAFIHGQIVSFGELAPYKVYEDEFFVCYDVTHLFYTDLRSYVESLVDVRAASDAEFYFDEQVYSRIENIYHYYRENLEIVSWDEFFDLIPDCEIKRDQTSSELVRDGLSGYITSEAAMEKIVISISTEADRKEIYSIEITPEDPHYYDLVNAAEVTAFIQSLEEGVYVINIEAWIDSDIMGYQDLSEQVFATGNATWPGLR